MESYSVGGYVCRVHRTKSFKNLLAPTTKGGISKWFVKILTGVPRCGKSTIMKMLMNELKKRGVKENRILHYNFDSLEHEGIKTSKALHAELKKHLLVDSKIYLFLDEIQEVQEWEKVVNSLMANDHIDIYVTGSNSRMMSSEISTYLTGRYVSFQIYPLSFAEYLAFRETHMKVSDHHSELANYLR